MIRGASQGRTKSPDPLSKERDDVNKLVSDLIGGSPLPASTSPAPPEQSPEAVGTVSPVAAVTTSKRKVKLVKEPLAPIIIRPKVSFVLVTCVAIHGSVVRWGM